MSIYLYISKKINFYRVEREIQMQQAMKTRATTAYANKLSHNDSSHNKNINDKNRIQNSETTEHIKEQLEQSLRAQRLAYKRSSINNEINSSNKKMCLDVSNSQSPVTSSSIQRMKLVPGKITLINNHNRYIINLVLNICFEILIFKNTFLFYNFFHQLIFTLFVYTCIML